MKNLFILFHETRSLSLRNILVEQNLGLARKVAHAAAKSNNQLYEDMYGLAVVGLIKGVERFNPFENNYFSSFAMPYIRGEIQHYLRDKCSTIRLHRKYQDLATKRNKVIRKYEKDGIFPKRNQLIEELGISAEIYDELEIAIANRNNQLKLDMRLPGSDDLTLGEAIPAPSLKDLTAIDKAWNQVTDAIQKINPPTIRQALSMVHLSGMSLPECSIALKIDVGTIEKLIIQGIEILASEIDVPLSNLCELIADFGSESDIKKTWDLASVAVDDFAKEQFYDCLVA